MVHAVSDARQVLARALDVTPDLVLTDLRMPFLDGHAVLARLRAQPRTAAIPVVLMSAADQLPTGAAFDAVLAKPFAIATLLAVLQRSLPKAPPTGLAHP